jgi:hypothetical protein
MASMYANRSWSVVHSSSLRTNPESLKTTCARDTHISAVMINSAFVPRFSLENCKAREPLRNRATMTLVSCRPMSDSHHFSAQVWLQVLLIGCTVVCPRVSPAFSVGCVGFTSSSVGMCASRSNVRLCAEFCLHFAMLRLFGGSSPQ